MINRSVVPSCKLASPRCGFVADLQNWSIFFVFSDFLFANDTLLRYVLTVSGPVIPISDVRGVNSSVYTKGERILRCKLASLYRLMDLNGWTSTIFNHITVSGWSLNLNLECH